jgi:SAM-dependent methyltransferase
MNATFLLKGSHYRSEFLYTACTLLKLGWKRHLRYRIVRQYINPADSVVDVCSGSGRLKDFISKGCTYTAIEASPEFISILRRKGIDHIPWNLHAGWPDAILAPDVIAMVISLSQFRKTSADLLLESFKKVASRVVIVEDVLSRPRKEESFLQRAINYLCATDYYVPVTWYTRSEFAALMRSHGYQCEEGSGRYMVGLYGYNL